MLPTFLGIGVPRAGTTWLHDLLASHPDVYVPKRRKEVHFFDRYYDRGIEWYEKFFPSGTKKVSYLAVGEITPHYLYHPKCPERIAALKTITHLLLILRNPIDRAYSHYRWRARLENYKGSFDTFIQERPEALEWCLYAKHIKKYIEYFKVNQILILIHEIAVNDVFGTKQKLAHFLRIDPDKFPTSEMGNKNKGSIPRFRNASKFLNRLANTCREKDLDWIPNLGKSLGIKGLLGEKKNAVAPVSKNTRLRLHQIFDPDIKELESIVNKDLSFWQ